MGHVREVSERVSLFSTRVRVELFCCSAAAKILTAAAKSAMRSNAQKYDVAVYAIGMGGKDLTGVWEKNLRKLAEETRWRAFFPRKIAELSGIFCATRRGLSSPYVLNRLIHGYFEVNVDIVWQTVTVELPMLLRQLQNLLESTDSQ